MSNSSKKPLESREIITLCIIACLMVSVISLLAMRVSKTAKGRRALEYAKFKKLEDDQKLFEVNRELSAKQLFDLAKEYEHKALYDQAVRNYEYLVDNFSKSPEAMRARIKIADLAYDRAVEQKVPNMKKVRRIYDQFLEDYPKYERLYWVYYRLAMTHYYDKAYGRAIPLFERVLKIHFKGEIYDQTLLMIGKCRFYREEYLGAIEQFYTVIAEIPLSQEAKEASFLIAESYMQQYLSLSKAQAHL